MSAEFEITVKPDGTIVAVSHGVTGDECLAHIPEIEALLGAKTTDSRFTEDYYRVELRRDDRLSDRSTDRIRDCDG